MHQNKNKCFIINMGGGKANIWFVVFLRCSNMINEINIFLPWIWETHQVLLGWVVRCYHCNPFFVVGRKIFCLPCNYSHLSNCGKSCYFFLLSNENSWIHECQSKLNLGFEVYLQSSSKLFSKCTLFHKSVFQMISY